MHPEDSPTPGASPVWHEAAQPKLAVGPIRRALDYERQVWWAIAVFPLFAVMLIAALRRCFQNSTARLAAMNVQAAVSSA